MGHQNVHWIWGQPTTSASHLNKSTGGLAHAHYRELKFGVQLLFPLALLVRHVSLFLALLVVWYAKGVCGRLLVPAPRIRLPFIFEGAPVITIARRKHEMQWLKQGRRSGEICCLRRGRRKAQV
jgi:hypothetical protein